MTLALLIVPANAIFLDAYGSEWLPATYIAIAVVKVASAFIARAARRTRLARVATASLGALAVLFLASWLILVGGGVWVSAVLLVLLPIALQLGFVFIGGQAGRLLDVRLMKEPSRAWSRACAVDALVGGLLGIPLLALFGSTEHLLLATTVAQVAFLALLLETERRFPEVRAASTQDAPAVERPPLRHFASGVVLLLLLYQVLSAMGSWVVDFLPFDAARYSGDDLTRFLSAYTGALNLADILFLAFLAGPLMRRFGLRLGLVLNPAVVAVLAVMAVSSPGRVRPRSASSCSRACCGSPTSRRPTARRGRRSTPRSRSFPSRSVSPCRRSSKASASPSRSGSPGSLARAESPRPGDRRRDRVRSRARRDLDGDRRGRVPVVHTHARGRDAPSFPPHRGVRHLGG